MIKKDVQSDKNWIIGVLFLLLAVCACICMKFGECNISIMAIVKTLGAHLFSFPDIASIEKVHSIVIWNIRLPRILLAITVGFALATSGTVFQGCFKNPLVEPYILGISSGAAFGASLGIVFPAFFLSVQLLAFFFGFAAVALAYFMARVRGETPVVTLILAGVITGSIFSAFLGIMKYLAQDTALREIVFWLMGGFYYAGWGDVAVILPIVAVCFIIIWFSGWQINVLSMGDQEAKSLGINAEKTKACLILLATLMTAVSVSAVGIIAL